MMDSSSSGDIFPLQPAAGPSTYATRPLQLNGDRASPQATKLRAVSPEPTGGDMGDHDGAVGGNKGMKRRPRPLNLRGDGGRPRVDPELQEHLDDIASAYTIVTDTSSLSDDMQNLSALRDTVHRNLRDRPVQSPHSGITSPDTPSSAPPDLTESDMTDFDDVRKRLHSSSPFVIVDTRPIGSYLDAHLPRSANLSIPSLILERVREGLGAEMTWQAMASYVTTPEGRDVWGAVDIEREGVEVVVLGSWGWNQTARTILSILRGMVPRGKVTLLRGGWDAVEAGPSFTEIMRRPKVHSPGPGLSPGQPTPSWRPPPPLRSATLPLHSSKPPHMTPPVAPEPTFLLAPPTPPMESVPRLDTGTRESRGVSAVGTALSATQPSLRAKRGQPTLSLDTGANGGGGKKSPSLSLNIYGPFRSATTGCFPRSPTSLRSPGLLKIDTTMARDLQLASSPMTSRFSSAVTSRLPSSPGSYGVSGPDDTSDLATGRSGQVFAEPESIPRTPNLTSRHAMSPFIVSTILPGFLYLGPEITNDDDVAALRRVGVKRILNVAAECDDGALGLKEAFDRYLKIPMRDVVEESGVGKGMRDSCDFLDDARLHDAPTYVHCRAGKSRSVTVVLAYLIHANAWTLKTAYAYVAERRKGISPNIGFVAELMQFEEAELGVQQSGGVHGDNGSDEAERGVGRSPGEGPRGVDAGKAKGKSHPRYARESLPPTWSSLGASKPDWTSTLQSGGEAGAAGTEGEGEVKDTRKVDEREVRKNGQWDIRDGCLSIAQLYSQAGEHPRLAWKVSGHYLPYRRPFPARTLNHRRKADHRRRTQGAA